MHFCAYGGILTVTYQLQRSRPKILQIYLSGILTNFLKTHIIQLIKANYKKVLNSSSALHKVNALCHDNELWCGRHNQFLIREETKTCFGSAVSVGR